MVAAVRGTRVGRAAKAMLALVVLGGAATGGAALADDGPAPAPVPRVAPGAPAESKLVPITPCRIVNTQVGPKLEVNRPVEYRSSTGTSQQGGAANCGIPAVATALVVSITAPQAEGNGYLRVGPAGEPVPTATFMNYTAGFNVTNGNTVKVRVGTGFNLRVQPFVARTHLIIDVLGYYMPPKFAFVDFTGALEHGSSVATTTRTSTGVHAVDFTSSVERCAYTVARFDGSGQVSAAPHISLKDRVVVSTASTNGTPANAHFYLTVDC